MSKANPVLTSAYQGHGWRPRRRPHAQEAAGIWSSFSVNSEYAPLKAVLLYKPTRNDLKHIRRPHDVQHLKPIAIPQLEREYRNLKKTYAKLGVKVFEIDPSLLPKTLRATPPNLMFVRDLFFNTPEGAVIARMASEVRAGEEKFAAAALAGLALPILSTVRGRAVFEGADGLWLNSKTVLCGTGARTNREGFLQLREILKKQNVRLIPVKMPKGVQHLLGLVQFVDKNLAVVRTEIAPKFLMSLLRKNKIKVIAVAESDEVRLNLGMNFVTVRPRQIVMAADCPSLAALFKKNGLKILAEVKISQLRNAAGGIGCATGILAREARS